MNRSLPAKFAVALRATAMSVMSAGEQPAIRRTSEIALLGNSAECFCREMRSSAIAASTTPSATRVAAASAWSEFKPKIRVDNLQIRLRGERVFDTAVLPMQQAVKVSM